MVDGCTRYGVYNHPPSLLISRLALVVKNGWGTGEVYVTEVSTDIRLEDLPGYSAQMFAPQLT